MGDNSKPPSLDDLEERLDAAQERRTGGKQTGRRDVPATNGLLSLAFRLGVEMVSALVVGVGVGLLLDWWLGTKPWFLVVFLILGVAAGILNVYRATMGFGLAIGYRKPGTDGENAEDEDTDGGATQAGGSDKVGGLDETTGKQGKR